MATYAIGDIQGCYDELHLLLDEIQYDDISDRLWFVGDLVNRGPHSLKVLQLVKNLKQKPMMTLGNHDIHLITVAAGIRKLNAYDTIGDVLKSSQCDELCQWLSEQRIVYHDETTNYVMVHAGLPPFWNLDESKKYGQEVESMLKSHDRNYFLKHLFGNEPSVWNESLPGYDRLRFILNVFTRMRFCNQKGELELKTKTKIGDQPTGFFPWFELPNQLEPEIMILFGHWAALEGNVNAKHVIPLDTGCVWGGTLSAFRLEDKQWFRVKSLQEVRR